MSRSNLLKGTMILTGATFISKFLGMIYVFPFYQLVGSKGAALYQYGYVPYSIFISIATMGVPLAVSKFVSRYNALGDYATGRKLFKSGLVLMLLTGFLSFLLLYLLAPVIAPYMLTENQYGNTAEDVSTVIRMVSVALIIVPLMSLIRGFFQGYQSMEPTAVSQVIEQIVRIAFILVSSFLVLKVFDGSLTLAVGLSTFAAFIGAIGGLYVLFRFWTKRRHEMNKMLKQSSYKADITTREMYRELLSYAGPFVLVSLAIPLFQLIDQFTFNRTVNTPDAETMYEILNFSSQKLVIIPVSLATAFGLTLIPTITASYTNGEMDRLNKDITQALQVVLYLTLPAAIGLSVLSYEAYGFFYKASDMGGLILKWYAPLAVLFGLYTVTAAIMQGINKQNYAVIGLLLGLGLKLVLNIPLISHFEAIGAILATGAGFLTAVIYNMLRIALHTEYDFTYLFKQSGLIVLFVSIMGLVVKGSVWLMSFEFSYRDGRLASLVLLLIGAGLGAVIYLLLGIHSGLAYNIMGERFRFLRKRRKKAV